MPSRRHNSAMLDSPRRPSSTIWTFSSDERRLRVARRMVFTIRSDDDSGCTDFVSSPLLDVVTMSQKSSLPQPAKSVLQALMSDTTTVLSGGPKNAKIHRQLADHLGNPGQSVHEGRINVSKNKVGDS